MCPHPNPTRSDKLIEGQVVLGCRQCRSISLEGDSLWILGGRGSLEQLRQRAAQLKEEKDRQEHFMNAPVDGELWEQVF